MDSIKGDLIEDLPSDKSTPSHNELRIVDTLFKEQKSTLDKIFSGLKDSVILFFLFIIFSMSQADNIITKVVPMLSKSSYLLICVKGLLFITVYFFIQNLYLARTT